MQRFHHIIIVWIILVCLIGAPVDAKEYTFDYQKIIEVEGPLELDLDLATGKVFLSGGDDNRLIVEAVKRVRAISRDEAEEVADHIEIKVTVNDSRVRIATNYLKLGNRRKSFWRKLFGGGSDSYGDVDYRILVPSNSAISVKAIAADIQISSVEGEIEIENATGSTRGEFLFGPVSVCQPTGVIDLQWVEGDIRIKSSSGTVSVRQSRGAIDLLTTTGNVTIQTELDSPRDYYVETTTGEITFVVPEASSGVLYIQTESGKIATEVPIAIKSVARNRLVGEFGMGGPKITLSSSTGDVTVAQF